MPADGALEPRETGLRAELPPGPVPGLPGKGGEKRSLEDGLPRAEGQKTGALEPRETGLRAELPAEPSRDGVARGGEKRSSEDGLPRAEGQKTGPFVGRPEALARWPWLADVDWDGVAEGFPVRIPRAYVEGATRPDDPRLLTVLPDPRERLTAPDDHEDPVGDARRSPVPWGVRKHADRVLLLLTKRCHLYCRYCFRRNHEPGEADDPTPVEWQALLAWAATSGAREAILSGGDPLAVTDDRLFGAIDALRPTIPVIRIHTRAPITYPRRVTPTLVAGLAERKPLWVLVHANHPGELSPEVERALAMLVDAGIPVLNQAVLLAGINDDVDVLAALSERLVSLRVFPYYLHHPDPAAGNAHFRVDPARGVALHRALRARTSGIGLPAYVVDLPDGSGKIPVEEWLARSSAEGKE